MENINRRASWGGWLVLGSFAAGAAVGLLFAPKKGEETREDLDAWRRKTRNWLGSIGKSLPGRVKAAAGIGAVKGGVSEAAEMAKEEAEELVGR